MKFAETDFKHSHHQKNQKQKQGYGGRGELCEVMKMLINLIRTSISQCLGVSNQFVHFKYIQFYLSIIPQESWENKN